MRKLDVTSSVARRVAQTGSTMAHRRTSLLGPAARPVAVPDDLDVPSIGKARGRVELPLHIRWSGSPISYDLNDRSDRARVYAPQVGRVAQAPP